MACECSSWDHYYGTGIMIYQSTCLLLDHAYLANQQQAIHDAMNDLNLLRSKWRRENFK